MSQSIGKDALQSILATKMAEFNAAMSKIQSAETEAIFAEFSAQRSQQRMNESLSMMSEFENIRHDSASITNYLDSVMISGALTRYNNILARIRNLQADRKEVEAQIKTESFNILNESLISMRQAVEDLNQKIENCDDPSIKEKLIAKKEQLNSFIERGEEIQKIENDEEAMKAFYEYAKDSYVAFNPNKDKYTEEQLREKAELTKPEEESISGYFEGVKSVWELYKGDMAELKVSIAETTQQAKEQQDQIKSHEEELTKQQEELDKQKAELAQKAGTLGVIDKTLKVASTITQPFSIALSLGFKAIDQVIDTEQNPEGLEETAKKEEEIQKLQESQNELNTQQEQLNNKLAELKVQQANLETQIERNEQIIQRFAKFENLTPEMEKMMVQASHNVDAMIHDKEHKLKHMSEFSVDTPKNQVVNNSNTDIANFLKMKDSYESLIERENNKMSFVSSEIYDIKGNLKKSDTKKEEEKETLLKQTDQAKFLDDNNPEKKEGFVKKLCDFIRNSTDNETKVVIDKSLSELYSDLAGDFGTDRVVVDKRTGNRRSGEDRRLLAQKQQQETQQNNERSDTAGRRTGDRRAGNHIFISEDTIRQLDLRS